MYIQTPPKTQIIPVSPCSDNTYILLSIFKYRRHCSTLETSYLYIYTKNSTGTEQRPEAAQRKWCLPS